MIALAAAVLAVLGARGENRLWRVDLELRGACDEVRLYCGADGVTRLVGPFSAAEDRLLTVAVPVRSPLGTEGLATLSLPRVEVVPAGAPASARVLGWSTDQPGARLAHSPLLDRPRPPAPERRARAGRAELLLVLAAGGFLLHLRRRPALALALALGSGLLALALARGRRPDVQEVRLIEWEAGEALGVALEVAADELALPREWLEVAPQGAPLELRLERDGAGRVLAPGAHLVGLESAPAPLLAASRNDHGHLAEAWTRDRLGAWRAHGAWPRGAPLAEAAALAGGRPTPPGWLAAGLPPGRTVLVARAESGAWLRGLGFDPGG